MNTAAGGQTRMNNGPSNIGSGPPNVSTAAGSQQQTPTNGQANSPSPLPFGEDIINGVDQNEQDSLKMFVGQIPKNYSENELRSIFAEYGEISQINVLRDKQTNVSKGMYKHLINASFVTIVH